MERECRYQNTPCNGPIEWHHPVSTRCDVGLDICQCHHSVLQGRQRQYDFEDKVNLDDLRDDLQNLELEVVMAAGLTAADIDKH